ncbi:MAG: response regulator transcription factor, partial [Candidatus Limnocylindrales bacterium]
MAAKILVVDDDPNVQRLLTYTLKQEGYEVLVASDGQEGYRLWGAETPALILLDIMLPKLDGYQVAAKIRTDEGSAAHVPIIMLTAEREVEQKVKGLRAGADDYLIKPFHPAELLARIKSLLARFAPRDLLVG